MVPCWAAWGEGGEAGHLAHVEHAEGWPLTVTAHQQVEAVQLLPGRPGLRRLALGLLFKTGEMGVFSTHPAWHTPPLGTPPKIRRSEGISQKKKSPGPLARDPPPQKTRLASQTPQGGVWPKTAPGGVF